MAAIQKYVSEKTGKVTYYLVFWHEGKQIRKKAGNRKLDADRLKAKIEHELYAQIYREIPDITIGDFLDKFLEAHSSRVRETSLDNYLFYAKKITAFLENKQLKKISPIDIEAFISLLQSEGKKPLTIIKYVKFLKQIFKRAVQWDFLVKSPAEYVQLPRVAKQEMQFLTPVELDSLIAHTFEPYNCLMNVACYSGLRISELIALKWKDVDFENGRIHVKRSWQKNKFVEPKTSYSVRSIPLPIQVMEKLKAHQINQTVEGMKNEFNLVFPNKAGKVMDRTKIVRRVFKPGLKSAGLKRTRFHDLRHSFAAALISAGENPKWIQKLLGHSSIMVTFDIYGHLLPDYEKDASDRIGKALIAQN
jgi:integrase